MVDRIQSKEDKMAMTLHKSRIELSFFSSVGFDLLGLLRTVCSQTSLQQQAPITELELGTTVY